MSHSLTQPEEIDYILRVMAEHDMEVDTPIPDGVQLSSADGKSELLQLPIAALCQKPACKNCLTV